MSQSLAVLSTTRRAPPAGSFATLIGANEPAAKSSSSLLATVAHEIRNPLANLRLSLDMLVSEFDELPAEKALALVQRVHRNVAWLNDLTGNLTSVAALEAGELSVSATSVDLRACVQEGIELVEGLLAQRHQCVRVYTAALQPTVRGDPARVTQVIANLLSNASRYSVDGDTIEIHLTASAQHVRVRVTDHGPGIAPEDQRRIFRAWVRGSSAELPGGGLGLGLSIVQNLVQRLGGRVGVESTLGQGATFWFTLPTCPA
jgi:signal transduction histidine kinase